MSDAKSALVGIANGSEEIETIAVVDTLRRAGIDVVLAAITDNPEECQVTCSRGVKVVADTHISAVDPNCPFDVVVAPGGLPGATHLAESTAFTNLLRRTRESDDKWTAAICAAPKVVLVDQKIVDPLQVKITAHPGFTNAQTMVEDRVVVDAENKVITSRGPGTALEFALEIVAVLLDKETAAKVAGPMLVK